MIRSGRNQHGLAEIAVTMVMAVLCECEDARYQKDRKEKIAEK